MTDFTIGKAVDLGPLRVGRSVPNRIEIVVPGHSYEVHINVPLTAGPARVALDQLARSGRFKLSDMDGHEHGEKRETILTTHGRDYEETQRRTHQMCRDLLAAGYELIRYKIEHVLIDSRVNDMWGLIDAPR